MTNDIRGTQPYDLVALGEFPLTKREYFAAVAMQGMLADDEIHTAVATDAVSLADQLIAELNKEAK